METWQYLFGSGVVLVAIIDLVGKVILWNKDRTAKVEDKKDENSEAIKDLKNHLCEYTKKDHEQTEKILESIEEIKTDIDELRKTQNNQAYALQTSLVNTILYRGSIAISQGHISVDEFSRLKALADGAKAVGANGVVSAMMKKLEDLIG